MTQAHAVSDHRRSSRQVFVSSVTDAVSIDQPSLEEWILGQLEQAGYQSLEQLTSPLVQVNWSELFLAIDRLVRSKKICLWPTASGDVVLSVHAKAISAVDLQTHLVGAR